MGNEQSQPQVGDDVSPIMLSERTVDAVAHYINNEASNIVVLTGGQFLSRILSAHLANISVI